MIYLARKNNKVVAHADKQAMFDLDGVTPEMEIQDEEFYAAECLARVVHGKIFIGLTDEEKAEKENKSKLDGYVADLAAIDREAGAGRALRSLTLATAKKAGIEGSAGDKGSDLAILQAYENRAAALRDNIAKLKRKSKK